MEARAQASAKKLEDRVATTMSPKTKQNKVKKIIISPLLSH